MHVSRLALYLLPVFFLGLVGVGSPAWAQVERRAPAPNSSVSFEVRGLTRLLEEVHYNRDAVKPESYGEIILNFMRALDGQRLFFLESDRAAFEAKHDAKTLYFNLTSLGRVTPAFEMFEVYEKRLRERVRWIFERLEAGFDLTTEDTYAADRREVPWAASPAEADILWGQRLKFELLQEVLNGKEMEAATEVIRRRYERALKNTEETDSDDLVEMLLASVARLYDPHSTYFSADTYEDFSIGMRLQLFGIGALLSMDEDVCVIREIIPGGPADMDRQLKPNDRILAVAQKGEEPVEIFGMKLRRIVEMIRGPKGTEVRLIVQPGDAADASVRREIVITRDVVNIDSSRAHAAVFQVPGEDGEEVSLGVITLPTFYGREATVDGERTSASSDVRELLVRLKAEGVAGIVLDLRNNGGGLLGEAIEITGLFIPPGPVVQIRSYYGDVKVDRSETREVVYDGPLGVLVSRFSASASEIVAGALQNYGRALIIGDRSTHGKGTVQTVVEMRNVIPQNVQRLGVFRPGATKLTIQKFYLPNGASTQRRGVVPDIILPSPNHYLPIGEGDLPHAMEWDEITTSFFNGEPMAEAVLAQLRETSEARQSELAEFDYLNRNIERFRERRHETTISLNLEDRQQRRQMDVALRESLQAERRKLETHAFTFREILLAPPPPPRIRAPREENTDGELELDDGEDEDARYAKLDVHLRESLRVLSDYLRLAASGEAEMNTMSASTASGAMSKVKNLR